MLKFCVRMVMTLTFAMAAFGLLIVSYAGKSQGQGPYHFFIMQAAFLVAGLIAAAVICRVDYRFFRNPAILWTLGAVMVVIPSTMPETPEWTSEETKPPAFPTTVPT